MAKFRVLIHSEITSPIERIVEADYIRLDEGHLIFRNNNRGGPYPTTVRIFAPGRWLEIREEKQEQGT